MLNRLRFVELNKTRARHRVNGIAGRIGNEVEMKPGQCHGVFPSRRIASTLWTDARRSGKTRRTLDEPYVNPPLAPIRFTIIDLSITVAAASRGIGKTRHRCSFPEFLREQPIIDPLAEHRVFDLSTACPEPNVADSEFGKTTGMAADPRFPQPSSSITSLYSKKDGG